MTDAQLVAQALRDIANEQQDRRLDLVLHKIADRIDRLKKEKASVQLWNPQCD